MNGFGNCHIVEVMEETKCGWWKRGERVTNEVRSVDERNEVEMEMGRGTEENVWRSVNVLSEHYSMNWKTHTYTHSHRATE